MRGKKFNDPFAELFDAFNRKGVAYVVVGMAGINYYAKGARDTFATQDFDIFLKPTLSNVKKALAILKELAYTIANPNLTNEAALKKIVREKKTILATDLFGVTFELILAVSGYTFSQMQIDAITFTIGKIPIKVGKLKKLLVSKKIAGREKDKIFLKRYGGLMDEIKKEK